MKFLHIADAHLDSPLQGLSRRDIVPAHITRDCTRRAFANAIDLAIEKDVAFVLIAGDLYDADWKDFSTALFFANEMRRLTRPCLVVRGNHDAASVITRHLQPPPNVKVFSAHTVETWRDPALGVAVHGRSFPNRAVDEDLSRSYPAPAAGMLNIGLLHTSAEDRGEHETYAPCEVGALAAKGYDYWALGHIHRRAVLHGHPHIIFPGNLQGRHVRETGAKGCTLVTVEDGRIVGADHHATDVLRWGLDTVDLSGAETMAEAALRLRFRIDVAARAAEGRPLILRLLLQGRTTLHGMLLADPAAIDAEGRAAAAAVSGEIYIERVQVETTAPSETGGALANLRAAFATALEDPDTQEKFLAEVQALLGQMPRLPGRPLPSLPQNAAALYALADEAWQEVAELLGRTP